MSQVEADDYTQFTYEGLSIVILKTKKRIFEFDVSEDLIVVGNVTTVKSSAKYVNVVKPAQMAIDPMHPEFPRMKLLTEDEATEFDPSTLPKIKKNDTAAIWYGAKVGQLICNEFNVYVISNYFATLCFNTLRLCALQINLRENEEVY